MALQNEYTSSFGTLHDEAYTKIDFMNVNCHQKKMSVSLTTWGSKAMRDSGNQGFSQMHYEDIPCEPTSSTNLVQQAYDVIKHYSRVTGSLDV